MHSFPIQCFPHFMYGCMPVSLASLYVWLDASFSCLTLCMAACQFLLPHFMYGCMPVSLASLYVWLHASFSCLTLCMAACQFLLPHFMYGCMPVSLASLYVWLHASFSCLTLCMAGCQFLLPHFMYGWMPITLALKCAYTLLLLLRCELVVLASVPRLQSQYCPNMNYLFGTRLTVHANKYSCHTRLIPYMCIKFVNSTRILIINCPCCSAQVHNSQT